MASDTSPALPPPPERDPYTISSIKRTLCASLLIWVSTPPGQRPTVSRKVVGSIATVGITSVLGGTVVLDRILGWGLFRLP